MEQIKQFIEKEIFQNPNIQDEVASKVMSLVNAFKGNRDILLILHDYISNDSSKRLMQREEVSNIVRREWFKFWTTGPITEKDMPIIEYYFDKFSSKDQKILLENVQAKLTTVIEHEIIKDLNPKIMTPLSEALYEYDKDNSQLLKDYVSNLKKVNKRDFNRIKDKLFEKQVDGFLPIFVDLFNKTKMTENRYYNWRNHIWIEDHFNPIRVLAQPREEIQAYVDILNLHYSKRCSESCPNGLHGRSSEDIKNDFIFHHTVRIAFHQFSSSASSFYNAIKELDTNTLIRVLENADELIKTYANISKLYRERDNIEGNGVEIIFNEEYRYLKEHQQSPGFKEFINIENLYKTHVRSKELSEKLSEKLINSSNEVKRKPKI